MVPVNYFHLVRAAILGLAVFGHMPDGATLVGMAMIFAAGVGVASLAKSRRPEERRSEADRPSQGKDAEKYSQLSAAAKPQYGARKIPT